MSLHSLLSVTIGVPNVGETAAYYADFGLTPADDGWFSTADAGRQLRLLPSPVRRLLELRVGADDADDLARATAGLAAVGVRSEQNGPASIQPNQSPAPASSSTWRRGPGRARSRPPLQRPGPARPAGHPDTRAPGFTRPDRVRPRKLGHAVLGSTDYAASTAFFTERLGFKISDRIKGVGAFMRCSTDHHNVLVLAAPVSFLHHTSWQVDDVDDVGRGAQAMLEGRPERHVWGGGRHYAGSNFFWYLKDPAGNFSEYYSDMDCIIDDQLWTPEDLEGARGLFAWGPPPPPSFLHPEDLAAMMTGAHSTR